MKIVWGRYKWSLDGLMMIKVMFRMLRWWFGFRDDECIMVKVIVALCQRWRSWFGYDRNEDRWCWGWFEYVEAKSYSFMVRDMVGLMMIVIVL